MNRYHAKGAHVIDETGLETLDKVAAGGVEGGGADGKPALPVDITTMVSDL